MNKETVSVIIPTYNRAAYLTQAIESVLAQQRQDVEIIVVDDGSTDNTQEVINPYRAQINYIWQENSGPSTARNLGIKLAKGKYIAFLDADDLFLPEKLSIQTAFLDTNRDVDVVYSDGILFRIDENGIEEQQFFSKAGYLDKHLGEQTRCLERLIFRNGFPIHAALARLECITEVGGFDENLQGLEDWDLWFRVAHRARFAYLDGLVAKYRVTQTNVSHDYLREIRAGESFKNKMVNSEAFNLLKKEIRAEFFYRWGISALANKQIETARSRLKLAAEISPVHIPSKLILFLTRFFGVNSIIAYRIMSRLQTALFGVKDIYQMAVPLNLISFEKVVPTTKRSDIKWITISRD